MWGVAISEKMSSFPFYFAQCSDTVSGCPAKRRRFNILELVSCSCPLRVRTRVRTHRSVCPFGHSGSPVWIAFHARPDMTPRYSFFSVFKVFSWFFFFHFTNTNYLFSLIYILNIRLMSWTLHIWRASHVVWSVLIIKSLVIEWIFVR
jgi:hypothetical protein